MVVIQDILVSSEIFEKKFLCNLNACKGACCWEGDWGAPLEKQELETLDKIYPIVKPFLTKEGIEAIEKKGTSVYYDEPKENGTTLIESNACAFMTYDENFIAKCGIEKAWTEGLIDFKKPISCHLYPIRVTQNKQTGFEALNYEEWDICSAACDKGEKEQLPLYKFVQDAIERRYGPEFYADLENAAEYLKK